jgi:hypothetical protein
VCVRVCTRICVCALECMHARMCAECCSRCVMGRCTHVWKGLCMCVCASMYVCMLLVDGVICRAECVCVYLPMYVCMCVCSVGGWREVQS